MITIVIVHGKIVCWVIGGKWGDVATTYVGQTCDGESDQLLISRNLLISHDLHYQLVDFQALVMMNDPFLMPSF